MITLGITLYHAHLVERCADFEAAVTRLSALHQAFGVLRATAVDTDGNIIIDL